MENMQLSDQSAVKQELRFARLKLGIVNLLVSGEESTLGGLNTTIVRSLGGTDWHLAVLGSFGAGSSLIQFMGMIFQKWCKTDFRALALALSFGVLAAGAAGVVLLTGWRPDWNLPLLWMFIGCIMMMTLATSVQLNIETAWIGDLVPTHLRGWFTSAKYAIATVGAMLLGAGVAWVGDGWPNWTTYALIFFFVSISHVAAILLAGTIPDRKPEVANFIFGGKSHHERLQYFSPALWSYIAFFFCWSGGRTAMFCFSAAYLMDQFGFGLTKIMLVSLVTTATSLIMLFVLGRISDRWGNRLPLIIVSGTVACSMFLWLASAWWGITMIIAANVVAGMAGWTHSMLVNNYGLEIFPAKGRAGYFGLARIFIGLSCLGTAYLGGLWMEYLQHIGWSMELWGTRLNRYHLLFFVCTLLTLCCVLPLMAIGKRTVPEGEAIPGNAEQKRQSATPGEAR